MQNVAALKEQQTAINVVQTVITGFESIKENCNWPKLAPIQLRQLNCTRRLRVEMYCLAHVLNRSQKWAKM